MVGGVFFDWFTTLADYEPPRSKLYCQAFGELGIEVPEDAVMRGVLRGDECVYAEHLRSPLLKRTPEERLEVYLAFPRMILNEANISASDDVLVKVRNRIIELFKPENPVFILFSDVLPNLKRLKERGLILGVVTNLRNDMNPICEKLGLAPYLDFILTSEVAGVAKPNPAIFLKACGLAGVLPGETVYVGDQYQLDIAGARAAGMKGVLIDRCGLYSRFTDCPRITTLDEIHKCLEP